MASRRKTLSFAAATLMVGVAGYYLYSAFAVQGQGTLAQAPLNVQTPVTPAFMMAVDDSGSMNWELLANNQDGELIWGRDANSGTGNVWGFFENDGSLRNGGVNQTGDYLELFPFPGRGTSRRTVPPTTNFGFARSPAYNPAYYDPAVKYDPWLKANGGQVWESLDTQSEWEAVLVDPRNTGSTQFNLTALVKLHGPTDSDDVNNDRNDWDFDFVTGMTVPAGTEVYDDCNNIATEHTGWTVTTEDLVLSGACDLGVAYFPATYYLTSDVSGTGPNDYQGTPLAITNAPGGPRNVTLYRYEIKPENYAGGTAGQAYKDAMTNFANWFTYYRNRNQAMVAGMTRSLYEVTNMRVGYFTINSYGSRNDPVTNAAERVTMYDMATEADRTNLFTLLTALRADGSTPNRQAVNAAGQQFLRTDAGAPIKLACQKNAVMLFTDGYSNQDSLTVGNIDGGMGVPFADGHSNTMADIITRFYLDTAQGGFAPLRTGINFPVGKVPVPDGCEEGTVSKRADCQANLHVNFYGITLGARGDIYDPAAKRDPHVSPYPAWPGWANDSPSAVDDIWHAAVNTRGEYINATTPASITAAMRRILGQAGAANTPSGSIALTGSRIGTGSLTVVPSYQATNNGTDWFSTLIAAKVTSNAVTGEVTYEDVWEAAAKLPAADARNIRFGTVATGNVPAVAEFRSANLGADPFARLCATTALATCSKSKIELLGVTVDQAVNYLRGDASLEVKASGGKLRDRTTRLGDIINSAPIVSSPDMDDYGYVNLRGTVATDFNPYNYDDYLVSKKTRDPMVYVGANDGMLHAFNGDTGVEEFAYVPATAIGHMGNLLFPYVEGDEDDQTFSHRYFVDGPITLSDARISGKWETVLVGTAGAGGRGAFGLNISDPDAFDNDSVLWEVNDRVADTDVKNNIGYVLGKPLIVPVKIGASVKWKAIFGNGYDSVNGKATLFVVDMESGEAEVAQAIEAAPPATSNGLGNIVVIDRWQGSTETLGRDGYADTVYGGDQNGAVWKFDLRTTTPTVALDGLPLFVAKDADGERQPILGGFEAASGPAGGVMVYFGTGSFSFLSDPNDSTMQSVYGVLDKFDDKAVAGRADLLQQKILVDGSGVRTTTNATGLGKLGWYMDLGVSGAGDTPAVSGERFVGNPVIASGIIFFPTYDPDSDTIDCSTSGNNWLYGLDAMTGGAALNGVRIGSASGDPYGDTTGAVKLDTKGTAPVKDVAVMTTPRQGILPLEGDIEEALKAQCSMVVQAAGSKPLYLPRPCGRQSWRQVL